MRRRGAAAALAAALAAGLHVLPVAAQTTTQIEVPSPILTLDQERVFLDSLWGKRAAAEIEKLSAALAAENRRIEAELTAEERALTEKRPDMPPEEFRAAADAFDARVVDIRRVRDGKARDLADLRDAERQKFFAVAFPILGEVLRARGAVAILDARAIFIASDAIDVTTETIARIDAAVGDGAGVELPPGDAPLPPPQPAEED